jgi:hypothetical protein
MPHAALKDVRITIPFLCNSAEVPMTEERKYAILFAATLLCARKLAELDSDKPSPAKVYAVNTAIEKAKFILDRIDEKWPSRNEP